MFGNNTPRKREHDSVLQTQRIFYTIQGEGPYSGQPALFIRLTGCNLRCWFCDTKWDDEEDMHFLPEFIAHTARMEAPAHCTLAVLTGGEPMRQDLGKLIHMLHEKGFSTVQIETSGSFWQECVLWPGVTTIISPKTAKINPRFKEYDAGFFWKYVLEATNIDRGDGLPSGSMQRAGNGLSGGAPARPPKDAIEQGRVYLQACDVYDDTRNRANTEAVAKSSLQFGYNAGVQMHKLLEVE